MADADPLPTIEPHAVLLIEDDPEDARLIEMMLSKAFGGRFRLELAECLTRGLERLERGGVEVVLLDLSLPESFGFETFVKAREHDPNVPVVVLTGLDDEELGTRAVHFGAQDYLVKGRVDGPRLGRALSYAIERGRTEKELRRRTEALSELDRRKNEFLAMIAEELRAPINTINAAVSSAIDETAFRTRDLLAEMINRRMEEFAKRINDLFDASKGAPEQPKTPPDERK